MTEPTLEPTSGSTPQDVRPAAVAVGSQRVVLTRTEVYRRLQSEIRFDDYGVPKYLFRTDMVPPDLFSLPESERQSILGAATLDVNYDEQFPALPDGRALWERLDFESPESHEVFSSYLEIPNVGEEGMHEHPVRSIRALAEVYSEARKTPGGYIPRVTEEQIREWFYGNFWRARARAYDLFNMACHKRQKERRAQSTEDLHYRTAREWIRQANIYMQKAFDNPEEYGLRPSDVIALTEKMMKAQRVALGLPALGPLAEKEGGSTGVQELLQGFQDHTPRLDHRNTDQDVQDLLKNPEALAEAQKLVLAFTEKSTPRTSRKTASAFVDDFDV